MTAMKLFGSARNSRLRGASILLAASILLGGGVVGLLADCGPFTDVSAGAFCANVLEIYYLGITTGTTATTYSPANPVTRLQMAAFLSRTVDRLLLRGGPRAALKRFWTPQNPTVLGLTAVGTSPQVVRSDGTDLWVANFGGASVSRVRGGDGKLLETWTGAGDANGVVIGIGSVFVTGAQNPGRLYRIDPESAPGLVTTVASNLGNTPAGAAFDGLRVWTANFANGTSGGSVSIVTPGASIPWTATTVTAGFAAPFGALFDGTNVWVTDTVGTLLKLNASGSILQTVTVGSFPGYPILDGENIWVPNAFSASVSVVRVSNGAVLATLTGNGLGGSVAAAFDGQRVLITNHPGNSVSLWKAADLTPLGNFSTGASTGPNGVCSDGVHFWIALGSASELARF